MLSALHMLSLVAICAFLIVFLDLHWKQIKQRRVIDKLVINIIFLRNNGITFILYVIMPGWHSVLMRWLSSVLTNALYVRSSPRNNYFVLSVCMLLCAVPSFAVLPGVLMHLFIHGGVNCLNSVPYRCYTHV